MVLFTCDTKNIYQHINTYIRIYTHNIRICVAYISLITYTYHCNRHAEFLTRLRKLLQPNFELFVKKIDIERKVA